MTDFGIRLQAVRLVVREFKIVGCLTLLILLRMFDAYMRGPSEHSDGEKFQESKENKKDESDNRKELEKSKYHSSANDSSISSDSDEC